MKKLFTLIFLSVFAFSYAQEVVTELYYAPDMETPKFQGGGLDKFQDYVHGAFDFKKVSKAGKVVATFTIGTMGELKNIKIVEFTEMDAATELIRVLKLSPKWESARRSGKPISVDIKFPMKFTDRPKG